MARRKPLRNVRTQFEAISKGAIEFANEMYGNKVYGAAATSSMVRRFPNLAKSTISGIFDMAKSGRQIAQRIMRGELQASEQAAFMPQNPALRKAYRYHAIAFFQRDPNEKPVSVNVYIDSTKPLGSKALESRMNVFLDNPGNSYRGIPQMSGILMLAAERRH